MEGPEGGGSPDESADPFRDRTTYLGRDYQTWSLQHQVNLVPVDDDEEERLRTQHWLMQDIFRDRQNHLLPDFVDDPKSILDCGFGTGEWASEVAEFFPDCEVNALDISPIMELGDMPENLTQEIMDLNDPINFAAASFDFVHSQFVAGGIAQSRWPGYLSDIKRMLQSKGWVQLTEWELVVRSENGNTDRLQALRQWSEVYHTALNIGRGNGRKSRTIPGSLEIMLRTSGFCNVQIDVRDIPACGWPTASSQKVIGEQSRSNMTSMLRSLAMYPITNRGLMSPADFDSLVERASRELADQEAKPFLKLYTCYGQKP